MKYGIIGLIVATVVSRTVLRAARRQLNYARTQSSEDPFTAYLRDMH